MALHALTYCERLFYLEEVEEIRVADHRVYAGRTLHEAEVDTDGEWQSVTLERETESSDCARQGLGRNSAAAAGYG